MFHDLCCQQTLLLLRRGGAGHVSSTAEMRCTYQHCSPVIKDKNVTVQTEVFRRGRILLHRVCILRSGFESVC